MSVVKWIIVLVVGLVVFRCVAAVNDRTEYAAPPAAHTSAPEPAPAYSLVLESFTCEFRNGYTRPKVTVRNDGSADIPYAKVYFKVGTAIEDVFLTPTTVPVGSLASADAMVSGEGDCSIVGIQDRRGTPVPFAQARP